MTAAIIFGLDLPVERYDQLSFRHIRPDWLECEAPLMTSKWWDYRFMNPCAATYLFAHHYVEEYRRAHKATIGGKAHQHMKVLPFADLFLCKQAKITAMWRCRQFADALCMPYELYARFAIEARMSYWSRAKMPFATQLYGDMVLDKVQKKWADHLSGHLLIGKHDAYKNENYQGLFAQDAHHDWAIEQAGKRANIAPVLGGIVKAGYLPLAKVKAKYGDSVAEKVMLLA